MGSDANFYFEKNPTEELRRKKVLKLNPQSTFGCILKLHKKI